MIITISDMWKNQQKMLDNDNQIKLSSLIVFLAAAPPFHSLFVFSFSPPFLAGSSIRRAEMLTGMVFSSSIIHSSSCHRVDYVLLVALCCIITSFRQ